VTTFHDPKYEKKILKILTSSISKDETRLNLNGVCHDESVKSLTSTNGHAATFLSSLYSEDLKNIIIGKNFAQIHREYARVVQIYPDIKKAKTVFKMAVPKLFGKIGKTENVFINRSDDKTFSLSLSRTEESFTAMCSEYLSPLADNSVYEVFFYSDTQPIVFKLHEEFNDLYIIMPLRMDKI